MILGIVALIGFAAFLIWELTARNPVVDLKVFRHRGYTTSMLTPSLDGAFFGITGTDAALAANLHGIYRDDCWLFHRDDGVLAIFLAPAIANLATKVDPRPLVFIGVLWLGIWTLYRSSANMDMTFWQVSLPMLFQGSGCCCLCAANGHRIRMCVGSGDGFCCRADELHPYAVRCICNFDGEHLGKSDEVCRS